MPEKSARSKGVVENSVAVIGAGNWGTSLARGIEQSALQLREVVVRDAAGSTEADTSLPIQRWSEAALDAELLWICVPDGAIAEVCAEIVSRRPELEAQIVVHSSGALPASVLEKAAEAGAAIASVHPVMSFPNRSVVPLAGLLYGVEAADAGTRQRIHAVLQALGGESFSIEAGRKSLYHAAGTLASPLLVSAFTAAVKTAQGAGLNEEEASKMVGALAEATLNNVLERGARQSFSGPFARGDAGTIRLHLQALEGHPVLAQVYRALAENAIRELPVRGREAIEAVLAGSRDVARNQSKEARRD